MRTGEHSSRKVKLANALGALSTSPPVCHAICTDGLLRFLILCLLDVLFQCLSTRDVFLDLRSDQLLRFIILLPY